MKDKHQLMCTALIKINTFSRTICTGDLQLIAEFNQLISSSEMMLRDCFTLLFGSFVFLLSQQVDNAASVCKHCFEGVLYLNNPFTTTSPWCSLAAQEAQF